MEAIPGRQIGLVSFDGVTTMRYREVAKIEDLAVAPDGDGWVAGRAGPYVIDPEIATATE